MNYVLYNCVLTDITFIPRLDITASCGGSDWKTILQKEIIGQTVMTKRPVRTYRVDDIDFTQNPNSTFQGRDGEEVSAICIKMSQMISKLYSFHLF